MPQRLEEQNVRVEARGNKIGVTNLAEEILSD